MRIATCGLVVLFSLVLASQTSKESNAAQAPKAGSVEQSLIQMEKDWAQAGMKKDVAKDTATLERIVAADWVGTDYTGKITSRTEIIGDLKSGASVAESVELGELKVRVFGDAAVVNGSDTEKSTWKGKDSSGHYVWSDVFVKRNGKWQAVSSASVKTN